VGGFFQADNDIEIVEVNLKEYSWLEENCQYCSVALLSAGTLFSCLFLSK